MCIGFNLPFDLNRIAIKSGIARMKKTEGFSLKLSRNLDYPRIQITPISSTLSFITWGNPIHGNSSDDEYQAEVASSKIKNNFVDLRTLCHALTNKKYSLESACKDFKTNYKKYTVKEHGKIKPEYIDYCINDVKSTFSLFQNAKRNLTNTI